MTWAGIVVLGVALILVAQLFLPGGHRPVIGPVGSYHTPVIDAGHGGVDGGAVSITGVNESNINLQIALKAQLLFRFYGLDPVMVRTEDISIHDPASETIRDKKRTDLQNRVKLVEDTPNAVLLSIHQNTFEQAQYHGAQSFYAPTDGSRDLAQLLQSHIRTDLDTGNTREAKKIDSGVYIMNNITCPAVLLECGFLSNAEEEAKLRTDAYQTKLAALLIATFLEWEE